MWPTSRLAWSAKGLAWTDLVCPCVWPGLLGLPGVWSCWHGRQGVSSVLAWSARGLAGPGMGYHGSERPKHGLPGICTGLFLPARGAAWPGRLCVWIGLSGMLGYCLCFTWPILLEVSPGLSYQRSSLACQGSGLVLFPGCGLALPARVLA